MLRALKWVVGGIVLVAVALMVYQGLRAGLALRQAKIDARSLQTELAQGDEKAATETISSLKASGRTARSHTDNLLWDAVGRIPVAGDSVQAIQVTSRVLDRTARAAAPAGLKITRTLSEGGLRSAEGKIDLDRLNSLRPEFETLASVSARASADLDRVRTTGLVPPLKGTFNVAQSKVDAIEQTSATGLKAVRLLPAMLGGEGTRHYLVAVQNNAEIRSTGGLPGAFLILTAQDGKVSITAQPSAVDYPILKRPIVPLTPEELTLFGPSMGEDVRDTNLTPDFPRAASIMKVMTERRFRVPLDGVLAVDPVALADVLGATGPIKVQGESFTKGNAVSLLLNEVYRRYPTNGAQNAYFSKAAGAIFDGLLGGKLNQLAIVRQLSEAGSQRRLLVWSTRSEEQKQLQGTPVAGELPSDENGVPHVGLYLNDAQASKIDYYLDYDAALTSLSCTDDDAQTLRAGMVLTSTVPRDVSDLPRYITGDGRYAPKGDIRVNLRIYAPQGGQVTKLEANGKPVDMVVKQASGHPVSIITLELQPGEQIRLAATMKTRAGQGQDPVLQYTPGVRTTVSARTAGSSCG